MPSVLLDWVPNLNWKQQSILLSGMRGPDFPHCHHVKKVNRWMRRVSQNNADPTKDYMKPADEMPTPLQVCDELEYLPCHFVHHFADALAVIAHNHPDTPTAAYATRVHYRIAEEIFHFQPEDRATFLMRHRDKVADDSDSTRWEHIQRDRYEEFIDSATRR